MILREAQVTDERRWNDIVIHSPATSFLQMWEWGNVQQQLQTKIWRFVVDDGGEMHAVALVLKRELPMGKSWLYIPRGPIFSHTLSEERKEAAWKAFFEGFMALADREKAVFVRIDPAWKKLPPFLADWKKAERNVQPQNTLLLDLDKPEEDLLQQMKSKTRYNIRLAERKGVTVRFSEDLSDIDIFLKLARNVSDRSSFSYHPDAYYRTIMNVLGSSSMAELAIAEYEGEALAAHMMIYGGDTATYAHGASSVRHRAVMAPTRLYWETVLRAKEKGCITYDFFGIAPAGSSDTHPWAGVSRIKLGFGGSQETYIGSYDFVVNQLDYYAITFARRLRRILK